MVICCEDCGIIIYWDDDMKDPVEHVDDISCPPYITFDGDILCCRCGPKYDEAYEDECDIDGCYDMPDFYQDSSVPAKDRGNKK